MRPFFLGKVRHGAPIPLHQQSGSIPSRVLRVSLCLQDSRFPWSVFHCPAPPWLLHSPRQARTHPRSPGFPVWGCWVTGAGEGLSIPREPSVRHGGMGLAGIPAGMLPLLGWPRRAQLLTQGSCHCHQRPPKAGAGHRAVLWGLFSVVSPPLSALFITIIKLRLFDPHESFCQRCLRVFVQSH